MMRYWFSNQKVVLLGMNFKRLLFGTLLLSFNLFVFSQSQIGSDIDGEAADDRSGYSVSLSSDGSTMAIGAVLNDGNGHVRVYKNISGTWTQQGADIDGEAADDRSGYSVSLSSDGSTVAIGATLNDGNGTSAGHVRVYKNISGTWTQQGSDIDAEAAGDQAGYSVSLSSDGSTMAIGAVLNDGNGASAGHVRIYKNISGTWIQQGADIDGEAAGDQAGWSVSLSTDGSTVAIGAPYNDGNGTSAGHVRVYKNISGTWTQQGSDIDGEAADDRSGYSVSLSSDGSTVAIGAISNDGNGASAGHVRIYKNISGTWIQQGSDIDAEAAGDQAGYSVSLSTDGSTVAIGAPYNDGNGTSAGHVRVYKNISGTWTQQGSDIDGEAAGDWSGYSVSLSSDGNTVAIGAILNDGKGTSAGHVRVYSLCNSFSTDTITSCNSYTWTNGTSYTASNTTAKDTFVNTAGCDSIVSLNLTILKSTFDTLNLIACDSVISPTNKIYKSSGTYNDTLVNAAGCDSIITTFLVIGDTTLPSVLTKNATLYLDQTGNATISSFNIDNGSSDNCGIFSYRLSDPNFDCSDIGANTIYLIVTDVNGNIDSASAIVTVQDTFKPIVVTQSLTISLDSNGNASITSTDVDNGSTDNCNIATRTLSKSSFDCADIGINTVYLIVTDVNGNVDSVSTEITVQDTLKPIVISQTVTISIDSNGNANTTVSDVDNGSNDNCSIATRTLSKSSFDCFEVGSNSIFLVVTDVNGNKDSTSATIIVQDTIKPAVVTQSVTVSLDSNGNGSVTVTDVDSGTIDNCGIDTIELSKSSFDCSELGTDTVYLIAKDVNGNIDSASAIVTVQDTIKPSAVTQPLTVNLDSTGIAIVNPMDADNGSYDNCNIANRTLSKSVFLCSDVGVNSVYLIVTDDYGNIDSASVIITVLDTIKPIILTQSVTVNLDASGNGTITPAAIDNGSTDNCGIASRTLTKSNFDCSNVGANLIYLIVTDVNGNTDSAVALINVIDLIKPTVVTQSVTVSLDANGNGTLTSTEVDNGSNDNCSIASRTLSKSNFDCSNVGINSVILTVTDVNGNIDAASAQITVEDTLKPIVKTLAYTIYLDASGNAGITVNEIDNGSSDNCSIANRSLSKTNFDCTELGANTIYLIVTDVNGNIDSASALITVLDTIKPTIVTSPSDIALGYCDAAYSYASPTGDDNCSVTVTQVAGLPSGSTFPVGITVNTFEISDPSGNTVSTSFTVDIRDRYLPFDIRDLSVCNNSNKIDLTKGYEDIIFIGSGVESNTTFFNPNALDAGSYTITAEFLDSMGCITTEPFEIVIRPSPVKPSINRVASDQIEASIAYDNYQWYRNGEEIVGEGNQSLRVNLLGVYSVLVGNTENCYQASEGYEFGIPVNDENIINRGVIRVFPNPTEDFVFVQINDNQPTHLLTLSDGVGNQLISQETNTNVVKLDISPLVSGTYYLNVFSSTTNETVVILKK
ncbi:MAG: HYR domain-containing protein [Bacteroidia bacterium]|nr:HYR domain-containing protein [Bacteroidia bacterium]